MCAHTLARIFFAAGNEILGCAKSEVAWFRLLWYYIFGLATVGFRSFLKMERSWRSEDKCTADLFGSVFVMAVYAPDCRKDLDVYETFVKDVTKVFWEGRRAGAKTFNIAGDLNV